MKSRSKQVLSKSVDAIIAAIEVYNKPTFAYREEAFAILAINAWELLLKARILQIDSNRISALIDYEHSQLSNGKVSKKLYRKTNRSGNYISIGLFKAFDRLVNDYGNRVDYRVRNNLEALTEIRDNAVHFFNKGFNLRKKVYEVGTASLKNYLILARQWFGIDLNKYQFFLMPIAFLGEIPQGVTLISRNKEEHKVIEYIRSLESEDATDSTNDFNMTLGVDISIRRVRDISVPTVHISDSPDATPITLKEEDIREQFPWDYGILTNRLQRRYLNFILNHEYHTIRKRLEKNPKLCRTRYLDPGNLNSTKKRFYSPNIISEFDKHYTVRSQK